MYLPCSYEIILLEKKKRGKKDSGNILFQLFFFSLHVMCVRTLITKTVISLSYTLIIHVSPTVIIQIKLHIFFFGRP